MTVTAAIVQARHGSRRLPGKVLAELGGRTVLWHVLTRCRAIEGADVVCCAVPATAANDAVASEAEAAGAICFRGSEDDVLARYRDAARMTGADVVLRVTSDCPLIDPEVCRDVIGLRQREGADFATNNVPPSWPHGLDCEAFTMDLLERAHRHATRPDDREHVSPWMRRAPDVRRMNLAGPGGRGLDHRWTLDYPEDLAFFEALFSVVSPHAGTESVLDALERYPEIVALNRDRHRRRGTSATSVGAGS